MNVSSKDAILFNCKLPVPSFCHTSLPKIKHCKREKYIYKWTAFSIQLAMYFSIRFCFNLGAVCYHFCMYVSFENHASRSEFSSKKSELCNKLTFNYWQII